MASHTIQKITLAFDEGEDRLRLAIEDADGQLLTLWLTQRLAGRLARALVSKLNSRVAAAAPAAALQDATRATIQQWEQAAAMAAFEPSAPVRGDTSTHRGLIDSIDLSDRGDAIVLVFRWRSDHGAALTLGAAHLRQWLTMLHHEYARAEWPTDRVWPDWLAQPNQAGPAQVAGAILH